MSQTLQCGRSRPPLDRRGLVVVLAAAAFGVLASPDTLRAQQRPDGASDAPYVARGAELAGPNGGVVGAGQGGLLQLKVSIPQGNRNTSATYISSGYALSVYHNISDLLPYNPTYAISTGSNYMTSVGVTTSATVASSYILSGDIGLDLFRLDTQLGGTPAVLGAVSFGSTVTMAGYGRAATASGGTEPRDGNARGFNAQEINLTADSYPNEFFNYAFFGSGLPLDGKGTSGTSGGPAFNSEGQLVGLIEAATLGLGPIGHTT